MISHIHLESTIHFWNYYEFIIFFANSLWIHYSLFVLQIDFESTIFYILFISRIHYNFTIFLSNELSFSRIHYEFTIYFVNSLWMLFWYRIFTFHPLFFLENSLWVHWLLRDIIIKALSFREYTIYSLSFSRNHYTSTIFFANLLWIHNLFLKSCFRIHYESTWSIANILWSHIFCEFTMNLLSFSWIDYNFTFLFANSPSITRIYQEFTICFEYSL